MLQPLPYSSRCSGIIELIEAQMDRAITEFVSVNGRAPTGTFVDQCLYARSLPALFRVLFLLSSAIYPFLRCNHTIVAPHRPLSLPSSSSLPL